MIYHYLHYNTNIIQWYAMEYVQHYQGVAFNAGCVTIKVKSCDDPTVSNIKREKVNTHTHTRERETETGRQTGRQRQSERRRERERERTKKKTALILAYLWYCIVETNMTASQR